MEPFFLELLRWIATHQSDPAVSYKLDATHPVGGPIRTEFDEEDFSDDSERAPPMAARTKNKQTNKQTNKNQTKPNIKRVANPSKTGHVTQSFLMTSEAGDGAIFLELEPLFFLSIFLSLSARVERLRTKPTIKPTSWPSGGALPTGRHFVSRAALLLFLFSRPLFPNFCDIFSLSLSLCVCVCACLKGCLFSVWLRGESRVFLPESWRMAAAGGAYSYWSRRWARHWWRPLTATRSDGRHYLWNAPMAEASDIHWPVAVVRRGFTLEEAGRHVSISFFFFIKQFLLFVSRPLLLRTAGSIDSFFFVSL